MSDGEWLRIRVAGRSYQIREREQGKVEVAPRALAELTAAALTGRFHPLAEVLEVLRLELRKRRRGLGTELKQVEVLPTADDVMWCGHPLSLALAAHSTLELRLLAVARNEHTPEPVLLRLAMMKSECGRAAIENRSLRLAGSIKAVRAGSPNAHFLVDSETEPHFELREALLESRDQVVVSKLLSSSWLKLEEAQERWRYLADTDRISWVLNLGRPEVIALFAEHSNPVVRGWVAAEERAPAEVLRRLSGDSNVGVRRDVARNLNTPAQLLWALAQDPIAWVREAALTAISRRALDPSPGAL